MGSTWAIVVAAGSATRYGTDKLSARLGDRSVLEHSVVAALAATDRVVVVTDPARELPAGVSARTPGGATRSASVRAGLQYVTDDAEVVVVHDGARPQTSPALWAAVIGEVRGGADAAIPGLPVTDTIKQVDVGGVVTATIDRTPLRAVQTPQAFRADVLRRVHASGADATDDAGLVEAAGGRVVVVEGEPGNTKLTVPDDLRSLSSSAAWPALRVGHGWDVHRVSEDPDRLLVLGGVSFPEGPGLVAHSDGDAVAHAVTDAVLAAADLPDIGQLFPDDDPAIAGADSMGLLAAAMERVRAAGWNVMNVDCTVVAERPKLAPRRAEMAQRLTALVGAPVTVKGRRAEGLDAIGRGEGLRCEAVALLVEVAT